MGGEQAANVLATIAKDQRAREGKQVSAAISPVFRLWVWLSPGHTLLYQGSGVQREDPGRLKDTDLEVVWGI